MLAGTGINRNCETWTSRLLVPLCIMGLIVGSAFALLYAFGATMTVVGLSAEKRTPHDVFLMVACGGGFVLMEFLATWLLRPSSGAQLSRFRTHSPWRRFGFIFSATVGLALVVFLYMFVTEV
jgi:hypothetical protein